MEDIIKIFRDSKVPEIMVKDIMTEKVYVLNDNDSLDVAKLLMDSVHIRHIPIINKNDEFVGLLTHRDLLKLSVSSLAGMGEEDQSDIGRVDAGAPQPLPERPTLLRLAGIDDDHPVALEQITGVETQGDRKDLGGHVCAATRLCQTMNAEAPATSRSRVGPAGHSARSGRCVMRSRPQWLSTRAPMMRPMRQEPRIPARPSSLRAQPPDGQRTCAAPRLR